MHACKTRILEYSWMSEIAWQNSSSLFRKIMTAIQTGSYLKFWTYQRSFGLFFNWMTMSMKHFWLGSALEFSTNLFFCQVCDGACFYTQCRSCASGKVPKSEDVYSPSKLLSLIFTTVATFSESLETYIYSFEYILLTVFAIHGIYFVGNLAILCWLCSASGTLFLTKLMLKNGPLPLLYPSFEWCLQTWIKQR